MVHRLARLAAVIEHQPEVGYAEVFRYFPGGVLQFAQQFDVLRARSGKARDMLFRHYQHVRGGLRVQVEKSHQVVILADEPGLRFL